MLVLSRKRNEQIVIYGNITVVVVEICGDKVRLGIEAPKEVPVHRREVYDRIARGEQERTQGGNGSPKGNGQSGEQVTAGALAGTP